VDARGPDIAWSGIRFTLSLPDAWNLMVCGNADLRCCALMDRMKAMASAAVGDGRGYALRH